MVIMKRCVFIFLIFVVVSTAEAEHPIFEFNAGRGSLRDWQTGTAPANTNVIIKNAEKGRAAYFDGTANVSFAGVGSAFSELTQASFVFSLREE